MVDFYEDTDLIISCPNCDNPFPVSLRKGEVHYEACEECSYLPEQNEIMPQVEEGLVSDETVHMIIIEALPGNDQVICDLCNAEIDETAEGGSFSGSYSLCPECTQRIWKSANEEERREITLVPGAFKSAVLQKRISDSQR